MTPDPTRTLVDALRAEIAATGPMLVADLMARALYDPQHGFYTRADGAVLGASGAFTTAPEVSQIFGELIGLWLAQTWADLGSPAPVTVMEIGPGRGVLMADALRAARLAPGFLAAIDLRLVEVSPPLRAEQAKRLAAAGLARPPQWSARPAPPPAQPLLVVANELFDALPVSQWRRRGDQWRPRVVTVDEMGDLAFGLGPPEQDPPPEDVAARYHDAPEGGWLETRRADAAVLAPVAAAISAEGGAGLIIEYGYTDADRRAAGGRETLQALAAHRRVDPLAAPGAADLTAHVNFDDLRRLALAAARTPSAHGLDGRKLATQGPVGQGPFLRALGAEMRAAALARANPARAEEIAAGLHRLTHPREMGALFKVMGLRRADAPALAGLADAPAP